ncbi:hypothetical protein HMPREF9086_1603 [Enterobacter hormaechei ATCC 49162]|nr:hypothetical protein HMPREF9086_1603 [Enterobacter hormaechei ATCC 49162]
MMSLRRVAATPYPACKMYCPVGPVSAASPGTKKPAGPVFLLPQHQN